MTKAKAKNTSLPCFCDDTLFVIEQQWGNAGYAVACKLWNSLGKAENCCIDLRSSSNWEFFRAKMSISEADTTAILDKLAAMKVIDPELWAQKIIWSDDFVTAVNEARRRSEFRAQKPGSLPQDSAGTHPTGDTGVPGKPAGDPCPHLDIVALFHSVLPELPEIKEWSEARRALLKGRWKEKAERQNLTWWKDYFLQVRRANFLMGLTKSPFTCTLEWLIRPTNMIKVLEGFYDNARRGNGQQNATARPAPAPGTAGLAKSDGMPYPIDHRF